MDQESYEELGNEAYPALRAHGQFRTQVRMRHKNGDPLWIDFGGASLTETEAFVMVVDVTATHETHERLAHAAFHDALTQLPTRALLQDRIEQALAIGNREHQTVAVGYLDLDEFKEVNDTHGHDAGDHLLREIARRLTESVRPADTVARMGDNEFVVLLTGLAPDEWHVICQRLSEAAKQPVQLNSGATVTVSATMGVALAKPGDQFKAHELIERADHAMIAGKRSGKSCITEAAMPSAIKSAQL